MARGLLLCLLALLALVGGCSADAATNGANCSRVNTQPAAGGGSEYVLYSHEEFNENATYLHNMSCTWSIRAPTEGSTWLVKFHEIDLEASVTSQRCKYDNLTAIYGLSGQRLTTVLCGKHSNLILLTNTSFELQFRSDVSISNQGFKVSWRTVIGREAAENSGRISAVFFPRGSSVSCGSLESPASPTTFNGRKYNVTRISMSQRNGSYIHNADCTWTIPTRSRTNAVYMTFESVSLEGRPPCPIDNITVTYRLSRRMSARRRVLCHTNSSLTLVSRDAVTLQLRTDYSIGNAFSVKWFVAPYTGLGAMFPTSSFFREEQCPDIVRLTNGGIIRMYYEAPLTYEPGMRCAWVAPIPAGMAADLKFTRFQLAPSYRSWRYNSSRYHNYCSYREDTVIIIYRSESYPFRRQSKSFCHNSNVQANTVVLTATGEVMVTFRSNGYRNSRGFILEYNIRPKQEAPASACPPVEQVDSYRQRIGNSSQDSSLVGSRACSWSLQPLDGNYLMSLAITLQRNIRLIYDPIFVNTRHLRPGMCDPMITVTSDSSVSRDSVLLAGGGQVATTPYRMEFCPQLHREPAGLFAGKVNVTFTSFRPRLRVKGFAVSITNIPRPKKGCSTVNVATKFETLRTIKIITITGKAGCIVPESLKDNGTVSMYSDTAFRVSFQLKCKKASSTESLDVISDSFVLKVRCGSNGTVFDSWKQPMVLKFPSGTESTLISSVTYEFPVVEAYCRSLNKKTTGHSNATVGSYLLPLFINPADLPRLNSLSFRSTISCNYDLSYRPGYSILLHINHNLAYEDLDLFCHAKTKYRELNPHIVLTAKERDPNNPDMWAERQLEMCHGYSVGSLGAKSQLLIDGSVSINLQALSSDWMKGSNKSIQISTMWILRVLNITLPQPLRFLITYLVL